MATLLVATVVVLAALVTVYITAASRANALRGSIVIRKTYTLQTYESIASNDSPSRIFDALVRAHWPEAHQQLRRLVSKLCMCVDTFVWGVQTRGSDVGLELYFYAPDVRVMWPCLASALKVDALDPEGRLTFTPQMVSVEVDPATLAVQNIDLYNIQDARTGYCVRRTPDLTFVIKNHYRFALKPPKAGLGWRTNPDQAADDEFSALVDDAGLSSRCILFRDWRISACVADKMGTRKGLYFSGVPAKTVLDASCAPETFRRALKGMRLRETLLDVGYDVQGDAPLTFCVYGSVSSDTNL